MDFDAGQYLTAFLLRQVPVQRAPDRDLARAEMANVNLRIFGGLRRRPSLGPHTDGNYWDGTFLCGA